MKKMLWLASWYPNKFQPFTGDFIQRHARAVSIYQPLHVIFVIKDSKGELTQDVRIEHYSNGHLSEAIAYYRPSRSGITIVDRVLSIIKYLRINVQLIRSFMKQNGKPVLVHVHVALWSGLLAAWLKKRYGIHYIVTEHWTGYHKNSSDNIYRRGLLFLKLAGYVFRNADLLLPVSRQLGEVINKIFGSIKYHIVPNTVDTNYFKYDEYKPTEFRFMHVSTMNCQKNMKGILNALSTLLLHSQDWVMIAIGPVENNLREYCTRLGLDKNVEWKGELAYEQVAAEMRLSSAMVMFSRYENMPCVILEAQCCGLPVIATAVGGIPEIINENNGMLIESGDENGLLTAMIDIMKKNTAINRKQIAEDASKIYSYRVVGEQLKNLYHQITERI